MNSYLVYLLLHGKAKSKELADKGYLGHKNVPVWRAYQKLWYKNKFQYFYERTDYWEYDSCKDIKGESVVKRIFDAAVQAINVHADFFLQDANFTHIRVYGSKEQPLLLPRYASDRMILMEFAKQLLFLKEKV